MIDLYQGDCLEEMGKVTDHTVDMIFTDLPYGTTKKQMGCAAFIGQALEAV